MNNLQVELKDRQGNELSTKAYIQSVLNEIDSTANSSTSYSKRFNRFFASLDSFALPYPSSNFADAAKLSDMREEQLTAEYREQRNLLKQRALSLVQPKRLGANRLVGAMLASLIDTWTQNVNIPVDGGRQNSASALMRHINEKEVGKAVAAYKERMRAVTLPLPDAELRAAHDEAVASVLSGVKLSELPDFAALFEREMNALYTEYVTLNEGNVRAILDAKLAQLRTEWQVSARTATNTTRHSLAARQQPTLLLTCLLTAVLCQARVLEWKSSLPQQPSVLASAEQSQKAKWQSDTEAVRQTAASLIGEYDAKATAAVESGRAELLLLSLAEYKHAARRKADDEAAKLALPTDAQAVDALFDGVAAQWASTLSAFSQLDAAAVAPYSNELAAYFAERRQHWQGENARESVRVCSDEAAKLGRRLLRDSERWLDDERVQSVAALNRAVDGLQEKQFCVGPGASDAKVVYQLYKVRREVGDAIRQRTTAAQAGFGVAALLALYSFALAKRAIAGRGDGAQYELLGHSDGKAAAAASGSSALSGAQRLLLLLDAALAAALLYAQSVVPDAATGMWLHGLWLLCATLAACSLVGLWSLCATLTSKSGKANHEH